MPLRRLVNQTVKVLASFWTLITSMALSYAIPYALQEVFYPSIYSGSQLSWISRSKPIDALLAKRQRLATNKAEQHAGNPRNSHLAISPSGSRVVTT